MSTGPESSHPRGTRPRRLPGRTPTDFRGQVVDSTPVHWRDPKGTRQVSSGRVGGRLPTTAGVLSLSHIRSLTSGPGSDLPLDPPEIDPSFVNLTTDVKATTLKMSESIDRREPLDFRTNRVRTLHPPRATHVPLHVRGADRSHQGQRRDTHSH